MSNITESARSRWTEIKQETREGANTATRVGDAGLQLVAAVENAESNIQKFRLRKNESITAETHGNYLPPKPFPGHVVLLKSDHFGYYGIGCYQATFKLNDDNVTYRIIHDKDATLQQKQNQSSFMKHSINVNEWKFTSGLIAIDTLNFSIKPSSRGILEYDVSFFDADKTQISRITLLSLSDSRYGNIGKQQIFFFTAPQGTKYIRIDDIHSDINSRLNYISHIQIYNIYHISEGKLPDMKKIDQSILYLFNENTWRHIKLDNDSEVRIRKKRIIYRHAFGEFYFTGRINVFRTPELLVAHRALNNSRILRNGDVDLNLNKNCHLGIFFKRRSLLRNGSSKRKGISCESFKYYNYKPVELSVYDTATSIGRKIIQPGSDEGFIEALVGSLVKKPIQYSKKDAWRHYYGFIAYYRINKYNCRHEIIGEKIPFLFKIKNVDGTEEGCKFAFERLNEDWNPIK